MKEVILVLLLVVFAAGYLQDNPLVKNADNSLADSKGPVATTNESDKQSNTTATIISVIDGDTANMTINNKKQAVRFLGIDTPEVDPQFNPVECYGAEASAATKSLLPKGQTVRLETDPDQDTYDKHGRLLAYVFLDDGTFINEQLIRGGYAREYTFAGYYKYQDLFNQAETSAKESKAGLWSCDSR